MWQQVIDLAINNGLWAVLFLGLLIYQIRDSKLREGKYQITINELSKNFSILKNVESNVKEINNKLEKMASGKTTKMQVVSKRKAENSNDNNFKKEA